MAAVACLLAAPASARFLSAPYSNIQVEGNTTNGANVDLSSEGDISTCDTNTSPAFFPLGTSTVSCGDGSFTVTVVDTTPPTLSGHSDINNVQATGPGGAVVNYSLPSASDTVDPSPNVDCNPGSGSTFALGTTKVTCNATDSSGNSSNTTTFNVTVVDTTAPTIHVPSTITAQATSSSGASVSFTVTATDAVDGSDSVGCNHNSGDTFGFGTTEVDCSATDAHGNTGTGFFDVTVVDTIKPVVTVPSNISDNSPDPGGKTETFTASASDNVDGPITPTCKPASGSNFVIGTTTVTCTATDAHGNVGQASFTVTITLVDTTPPVITVPSDITVEATGPSGAAVSYSASANDNIDGTIIPTCNPASSSTFPLGTTTVTCSATDAHNNTASKTFNVTVQDTTPPTITVPANITTEATGPGGAAVTYTATSSDVVDGTKAASCSPASGSTFAIKTTTVTCNATDAHGNAATQKTFTVTVQDTTKPVVTPPASFSVQANSPTGATGVTYTNATATDTVDGSITPTCLPSSGSTFSFGQTTVTCSATDAHNNTGTATFTVTVVDTIAPVIAQPSNVTIDASGPGGGVPNYTVPTATDSADGTDPVTCAPGPSTTFGFGTTTVTCNATDAHGNKATPVTFTVTVSDKSPPVISVPANQTLEATSGAGAAYTYTATASDTVDGSDPVTCNPASGATFPLGTTTVTCNSSDKAGNAAAPASFSVKVVDTTPPVIAQPSDVTAEATGQGGATPVSYTSPTATDAVDGTDAVNCAPASGSTFQLGSTTVSCNATDAHGNKATPVSFAVHVVDTTPPTFSGVPADSTREADGPNGSNVTYTAPTAGDIVDGAITPTCSPTSGSLFPLGPTTVTCTATDAHSNSSTASFKITVVDTTPPRLVTPPDDWSVYATTTDGVPRTDQYVGAYVQDASATDIVDPHPAVTNNMPAFVEVGSHDITFTATDEAGNSTSKTLKFSVRPMPPPGTTVNQPVLPPNSPPPDPTKVKAKAGDGVVTVTWANTTDSSLDHVQIEKTTVGSGKPAQVVYTGKGTKFVDHNVTNGDTYRYVVSSVGKNGAISAGVAVTATPQKQYLRGPKTNAKLTKPPKLTWLTITGAAYYNVQVYRGKTTAETAKILSTWPHQASLLLTKSWKYDGRKFTLTPGFYTWDVFPGFGNPELANYGPLLGTNTFQMVKPKPKPKKKRK